MRTLRIILPSSYRVESAQKRLEACPRYRVLHTVAWSSFLYAHRNPNRHWMDEVDYQLEFVRNRMDDLWSTEIICTHKLVKALWEAYKGCTIRRNYPDCSVVAVYYTSTGIRVTAFEWDDSDKPF